MRLRSISQWHILNVDRFSIRWWWSISLFLKWFYRIRSESWVHRVRPIASFMLLNGWCAWWPKYWSHRTSRWSSPNHPHHWWSWPSELWLHLIYRLIAGWWWSMWTHCSYGRLHHNPWWWLWCVVRRSVMVLAMHGDIRIVVHWCHLVHLSLLHTHVVELLLVDLVLHLLLLPHLIWSHVCFIFFVNASLHVSWTPVIWRTVKRLVQKIWIRWRRITPHWLIHDMLWGCRYQLSSWSSWRSRPRLACLCRLGFVARGGLPGGRPVWQLVLEVLSLNIRVLESGELWLKNLRLLPRRELLTLPILYINLELANSIKHTHFVFEEGKVLGCFIVVNKPI